MLTSIHARIYIYIRDNKADVICALSILSFLALMFALAAIFYETETVLWNNIKTNTSNIVQQIKNFVQ